MLRVVIELAKVYPISSIVYEYCKADVDLTSGRKKARSGKRFSPVMVGQKWILEQLSKVAPVTKKLGWQTSNLRKHLGLKKQKHSKGDATPATHAVDSVTLASFAFIDYLPFENSEGKGHCWKGKVNITDAPFFVIRRPPISRRQLHLMVFAKGGKRRKYGGTVTRHGIRKGDYVVAERKRMRGDGETSTNHRQMLAAKYQTRKVSPIHPRADDRRTLKGTPSDKGTRTKQGIKYYGWCSGDTKSEISVSDSNWKRLGQFSKNKTRLIKRSTGLICKQLTGGRRFLPTLIAPQYRVGLHAEE